MMQGGCSMCEGQTKSENGGVPMFDNYPDIVSIEDVMSMLGVGKSTAYSLLRNNALPHVRVGRKYIIPKHAVIGFVQRACYNSNTDS